LAGLLVAAVLVAGAARYFSDQTVRLGETGAGQFGRQAGLAGAGIAGLLLVAHPAFTSRMPLESQAVLRSLRSGDLSARDAERLQRGYYENLIGVNALNSQLWEVYAQRPDDWQFIAETPAGRNSGDFLEKELVPGAEILWHGAPFRVNRWGMRDRDYERTPPPNTRRIAVFGASYTIGSGVGDGKNWESLVEDRLNRERAPGAAAVEILNFAVPGYTAIQSLRLLDIRALEFAPNVVWLVTYPDESLDIVHHIVKMVRSGVPLPYPRLDHVVAEAGVTPDLTEEEAKRRLLPLHRDLLAWTYGEVVARCRARGIRPVWIFLPATRAVRGEDPLPWMMQLAADSGFATAELATVYDGYRQEEIIVAPYDFHPNEKGHRIIADRLYQQLAPRPELVGAPDPGQPAASHGIPPAPAAPPDGD
ncbi:MAG: SGNH/GDSL hydrolase family protein, partial [Gemmatimonadota bacterium]|nr:SGNH/GDSL hydrolase family protein [Gemmatimonadota bacterium]